MDRPTVDQVFQVVEQATETAERVTERVLTLAPPPEPIACRAGCAWCCRLRVGVTAPEVFRIAAYLRSTLSSEDLSDLVLRLATVVSRTRGLDWAEHAALNLPCPLLVDERCCVHPVRPLSCRGHNSLDANRCRDYAAQPDTVTIPVYTPQQEITDGLRGGLSAGLEAVGLQGEMVELAAAVRLVLAEPEIADLWLTGERVFS